MKTADNILSLIGIADKIEGRTKFQKMVYILKCKGAPFNDKFRYYHYGPYSFDLQVEMDELASNGQLLCDSNGSMYTYTKKDGCEKNDSLTKYKDLINKLNAASIQELELTSTIFFLRKEENIVDDEIIKKKLKFLKPHLEKLIPKAFKLEKEINAFQ